MKRIFLIIMLVAAFGASRVFACSCMVSGTVDQEYLRAANVVILKARSVLKTDSPPPMLVNYDGIKQTTLTVEKVYKGTLKVGQELIFAQGGGADCIWTFTEESIGNEYLFYLGAKPIDNRSSSGVIASTGPSSRVVPNDAWVASTCSRSGSAKFAAADILYLENRVKADGRSRLSGRITRRVESPVEEQPYVLETLSDRGVVVTGNGKTIKLNTDKDGVYEVYDLPPGKYTVRPEPIEGYKPGDFEEPAVEIKIRAQTEQNFEFEIDSAIRGKFIDLNGKPLKNVCMELVPSRGTRARYFRNFDCTDAGGLFELTEIPTGSYFLAFNYDDKITADVPFRAFYYPKATARSSATEINIAPGTKIDGLVIVPPETVEVINVSGILRLQDGKAANKVNAEYSAIEFIAEGDTRANEDSPSSRATPDDKGNFTIRVLTGQKGRLYGTFMTYRGEYQNCPKLENLIPKKDGTNIVNIKTPALVINAERDQTGVELTFPFPGCKKAKID